jgi:prepilin-type N-terminal cleavage/methylation domain-containing protein
MPKIFRSLKLINRKQLGFTLIELAIAMAISGLIAGAVTMTMFQIIDSSGRTSTHMTAVRQVRSAGYWVTHDVLMAQDVAVAAEPGFPFTLTWSDWTNNEVHTVVYSIVDDELQRADSTNSGPAVTTIVAEFIDPANTSCEYVDGTFVFNVTAQVGSGSVAQVEARTYEVIPRPGL